MRSPPARASQPVAGMYRQMSRGLTYRLAGAKSDGPRPLAVGMGSRVLPTQLELLQSIHVRRPCAVVIITSRIARDLHDARLRYLHFIQRRLGAPEQANQSTDGRTDREPDRQAGHCQMGNAAVLPDAHNEHAVHWTKSPLQLGIHTSNVVRPLCPVHLIY
jgi:hypothetical protein